MNPKCKGDYAEPSPVAETLGKKPVLISSTVEGV